MLIAGIDEAGRGPVLGPMVIAVTVIDKNQEEDFRKLGIKDSKELTVFERKELYPKIIEQAVEWKFVKIEAEELDELMKQHSLNEIEAIKIGGLLNSLKKIPDIVIVDSPDVIQANFGIRIKKYYKKNCIMRTEHKADQNHVIVGAASIIAKVERDQAIEKYAQEFGEIGSGYSHDPKTIQFLKNWLKTHSDLPKIARRQWQTSEKALNEKYQKKLGEY
ncbi:MAG: ribonuclease HII [Candidatus Diapherotrites archaeon]|nr:ribonuclease HII [Candidatus Diapherotrites archaeon]